MLDPVQEARFVSALFDVDFDFTQIMTWRRAQQQAINEGRSPAMPEMWAYFEDLIRNRRQKPGNGLLGQLIAAQADGYQVDGEPMSDWDLIGSVWILIESGATTANLGYTLVNLATTDLLDRARHEPDVRDGAVEESLRLYPGLPVLSVRARRDVDVGGTVIPAGSMVRASIFAANRDETVFADPDRFLPQRQPTRT